MRDPRYSRAFRLSSLIPEQRNSPFVDVPLLSRDLLVLSLLQTLFQNGILVAEFHEDFLNGLLTVIHGTRRPQAIERQQALGCILMLFLEFIRILLREQAPTLGAEQEIEGFAGLRIAAQ